MYKTSDRFIRVAQFQPVKPTDFIKDDKILTEDVNPISIWADPTYYAAVKGQIGSGVYSADPNILKTLEGVPARFKNMELDDVMREINNFIPAYNPSIHGSLDNYRTNVLPSLLDNPEKREFAEDAERLIKVFRSYLAKQVIPQAISDDPVINEEFKKGIEKILYSEDSSSPLFEALRVIKDGPQTSQKSPSQKSQGVQSPGGKPSTRDINQRVTSDFGFRDNPNSPGNVQNHLGKDYAYPIGYPVKAAMAGVVTFSGLFGDYGLLIKIKHAGNLESRYAHLSKRNVSVGDNVESGQQIGEVGQSGNATGPHLHLEIRLNGSPIDPSGYSSIVL